MKHAYRWMLRKRLVGPRKPLAGFWWRVRAEVAMGKTLLKAGAITHFIPHPYQAPAFGLALLVFGFMGLHGYKAKPAPTTLLQTPVYTALTIAVVVTSLYLGVCI